jgi:hypothetical protein
MKISEESLQIQVFQYLELKHLWAFHAKNSGRKSIGAAVKDKRLGVRAGVPDISIIHGGPVTHYIELKTGKGRLSPAQIEFRNMCTCFDVPWALCRSLDEVVETLKEWGMV